MNNPIKTTFCSNTLCMAVTYKDTLFLASETLNFILLKNKPIFYKSEDKIPENIFVIPVETRNIFVTAIGLDDINGISIKIFLSEIKITQDMSLSEISLKMQEKINDMAENIDSLSSIEIKLYEFVDKDTSPALISENFTYDFGNRNVVTTGKEQSMKHTEISSVDIFIEEEYSLDEIIDYINNAFKENELKSGYNETEDIKNRVKILKITPQNYKWIQ